MIEQRNHLLIIASALCLACFVSCDNNKTIKDPNGVSEMAAAMRHMTETLESYHEEGGELPELDFADFEHMQSTDSTMKTATFRAMSHHFQITLQNYNSEKSPENYQTLIDDCVRCHTVSCPGPLDRIERLR